MRASAHLDQASRCGVPSNVRADATPSRCVSHSRPTVASGRETSWGSEWKAVWGPIRWGLAEPKYLPGLGEVSVPVPSVARTLKGDTLNEANEQFLVSLTNPTNATIGGFFGLGPVTITNNDPVPIIVPGGVSVVEGNSGTKVVLVPVSLSVASGQIVTASWSTLNDQAVAPGDYVTASGTVTFLPGQTSQTVPVIVQGDTLSEADERFLVSFTNPRNATIGGFYDLGVATITNDD